VSQPIIIFGPDKIIRYVIMWDGSVPIRVQDDERYEKYDGPVGVGWKWEVDRAVDLNGGAIPGQCVGQPIAYGRLSGIVYDFLEAGDVLPIHTHGPTDVHITIVARGSFLCHGDRGDLTLSTGDVVDWEPGEMHGFKATEANSRLINIIKA
jgi:hypothetical protein